MSVRTKVTAYFHYLTADTPHTWRDWPALGLLCALAWLYEKILTYKYEQIFSRPDKRQKLKAKVISLGNITVGGTGKTPTACLLAAWLQAKGKKVALLNRGYRAEKEKTGAIVSNGQKLLLTPETGGDEACLMARSLPGIPVLIGQNRAASGRVAEETFGAEILLLDDGFQHWQLVRDLDIVLIDATNPFGNGHVLPRGILREPLAHLDRAGFFLLTKTDQVSRDKIRAICQTLQRYNLQAPVAESIHQPTACLPFSLWNEVQAEPEKKDYLPKGQAVLAVSALGNPASFEQTLADYGLETVQKIRYEDHHHYTEEDFQALAAAAKESGLPLVTTEKDAVKMPAAWVLQYHLPLYVLKITIVITKGKEEIERVLEELL